MKKSSYSLVCCRASLIAAVVLLSFAVPGFCQNGNVAVMIQQSPPEGGVVTPGTGVHSLAANSELMLSAVPRPGYQFVCWLGDVSDTSASRTATFANSPKIIIAVFERTQFDFLAGLEKSQSGPAQRLFPSAADYSRQESSPVAGKRPHKWHYPEPPDDDPEEPEFPVPNDENDFPVPEIPEPATAILLAIGSHFALRHVSRRKISAHL